MQAIGNKLENMFSGLYRKNHIHGVVLAAEQGQIIYEGAFGQANREEGLPLTSRSIFELASVSKPFTAAGIMLLADQGRLGYDDLVQQYIPALPYAEITVRHLLTHTSGVPDYMTHFLMNWDHSRIAVNQDVLDMLVQDKPGLLFAPGDRWEYSNTGYVLLACLIEQISGMNFPDYMQQHMFEPLGMSRTLIHNRRHRPRELDDYAYGYVLDVKTGEYKLPDELPELDYVKYLDGIQGDGTVNSTAGDLLIFDQALYSDRLLSKEALNEAFRPVKLNNGETFDYGFGWIIKDDPKRGRIVFHNGGWPGYSTSLMRFVDEHKTLIYLNNREQDLGFEVDVLKCAEQVLFGEDYDRLPEPPRERQAVSVNPALYDRYTGQYRLAEDLVAEISTESGQLFIQITGQVRLPIYPSSETRYFLPSLPVELEFVTGEGVQADQLVIYSGDERDIAVRIAPE
ncbi:penicillin-binding protein [Paenibacillus sp. CAA11]|uniref:serine hydrolase n=1 Tax=Paenibacillus sp. CAA11 TaxID=1532905 RepID=UPI000D3C4F3F|nr:serine hydrolase [Paenibacillus sp. CAA11]AWB46447.1 penicillin-binding protein [Paenibacillus sp. CAA11]